MMLGGHASRRVAVRAAAAGARTQRRTRITAHVKRSDTTKKVSEKNATAGGRPETNKPALSTFSDPSAPSDAEPFHPTAQGFGAALIHGHYERLGNDVSTPEFLRVPKTACVIGAPMSWGQPRAGTDHGSQILRDCGLEGTLLGLEWRIDDVGDLEFDPPARSDPTIDRTKLKGRAKNNFCVGKGLKKIHDEVHRATAAGEFALVLGGDHSIAAGSVSAILRERPETGIIWVDAHGDLNTPDNSPSGNMHGMPLGLLMGLVDTKLIPGFEWLADLPRLKPEQLVFVGLRDLDAAERDIIIDKKIKAFTMQHVDRYGIGRVMEMALEHLRLPDGSMRPLHLSYDIDAVDPDLAPSTGTVVRGGFNFREAHFIAEAVSETNMLGSMDLVEVNPKLTPGPESDQTAQLGMALIASAMGSRIL